MLPKGTMLLFLLSGTQMNVRRSTDEIKPKVYFISFGHKDERAKSIKGKKVLLFAFSALRVLSYLQPFVCAHAYRGAGGSADVRRETLWKYTTPGNTGAISTKALTESVDMNPSEKNAWMGPENVGYLHFYLNKPRELILSLNS